MKFGGNGRKENMINGGVKKQKEARTFRWDEVYRIEISN